MIHVILKRPLNLVPAVILARRAVNSPVESKTILPSLTSHSTSFGCYLSFFSSLSIIRSVCRLSSVCVPSVQLGLCHCGTARVPSRGRILCGGDKRQLDCGWHTSRDSKVAFPWKLLGGLSDRSLMNVKVAILGFATGPTCFWELYCYIER